MKAEINRKNKKWLVKIIVSDKMIKNHVHSKKKMTVGRLLNLLLCGLDCLVSFDHWILLCLTYLHKAH